MGQKKKVKSAVNSSKKRKLESSEAAPSMNKSLAEQSFEEFLEGWDNVDAASGDDEAGVDDVAANSKAKADDKTGKNKEKKKKVKKLKKKSDEGKPVPSNKKKKSSAEENKEADNGAPEDEESSDEEVDKVVKKQKNYIGSLKNQDPEFYKFLQKEDAGLLDFGGSSDEGSEDEDGGVHKPPDALEIDSDESDYEFKEEEDDGEEKVKKTGSITKAMIDDWTTRLSDEHPGPKIIQTVAQAFLAAVETVGLDQEKKPGQKYRVVGSSMFNAVVRMCVVHLNSAIKKYLGMGVGKEVDKPRKSKKWHSINKSVNLYLECLCVLVSRMSEPQVALVLLKHTLQMIPFFQNYGKGEKLLLKGVVRCWGRGEDSVRVSALLCIVRMAKHMPNIKDPVLSKMFNSYAVNSKFTSPSNLANINFMRRSLVEIYGLDHKLAYYQAFVQIRQLAIHLRNAMLDNKKENVQAVYNWQYVHSLELWGALLGHATDSEVLRPLIYPLVQVLLGTIKLMPTAKYYPLRFHCANVLTKLSVETHTFIPVLPIYLDVFKTFDINKKHKKPSMRPLDMTCILKCSKSQMSESGFKDAIIEECYAGMLTYLALQSHKIGFPELITPMIIQTKAFIKGCKVGNYTKMMKQVLEKAAANQKFIEGRRKGVTFGIGDDKEIQIWEAQVERDGTPMKAYYNTWKKASESRKLMRITSDQRKDEYLEIPEINRDKKKTAKKAASADEEGFLAGEDVDPMLDEERFKLREERTGRAKIIDSDEDELSDDDDDGSDLEDDDDKDKDEESDDDVGDMSDGDAEDNVKDLKLEDLDDSESEAEMKDDFGDNEDESDDDDGSDDSEEPLGRSSDDDDSD